MTKWLDAKLAEIHADPGSNAFILADAKDADMAYGVAAPGRSPESYGGEARFRSLQEWRDTIRRIVEQGLVDIMLMSASTNEVLTIRERIFDGSPVTPAVRANDTTDIHVARGSIYPKQPSLPFRTATIEHIQCGQSQCTPDERSLGANLGLYSVTFNNDARADRETLEAYKAFRVEAEQKGFRHFLEIFDPNAPVRPIPPGQIGGFINDLVVRALAGVTEGGRPLFLKMVYHGPKAMEELVRYDRHLVPGVLGGSAGTTCDAFKLLAEAKKYGARAALFGRKINGAEHQLAFVQFLRLIADGEISPEEAVRAYHGVLQGLGIRPHRPLDQDMQLTSDLAAYAASSRTVSIPSLGAPAVPPADARGSSREVGRAPPAESAARVGRAPPAGAPSDDGYPKTPAGLPDFARMSPQERLAYHRQRLDAMFA